MEWHDAIQGFSQDAPGVANHQHSDSQTGSLISNLTMPRHVGDDEEPLEDTTAALQLHNKRTERMQRNTVANLSRLPTELLLGILKYLGPRDVFHVSFVTRRLLHLVTANATAIGDAIIASRYSILAQCFPTPLLLSAVDPSLRPLLTALDRRRRLGIHKRPYHHIQSPDALQLCTCLTCILTWNNLALVLDFAHWQDSLDSGKPVPIIPHGQIPAWNTDLITQHARIARKAVDSSLWHARILQLHLDSTVRSITRHAKNKRNMRIHIAMTPEDAVSETDSFLAKYGPLSLEHIYQRDEYHMLEAYLPNRWWREAEGRWVYTIRASHDRDLELLQRFAAR
ncbi:hypothetical protein GQ44DRAFT_739018 [Phaeosphaeriaceae sp. PMI808]|nr:hypothetical protein GQ44DRAFT_739018 [Phaeosphaeriaceae sp. PMI808]